MGSWLLFALSWLPTQLYKGHHNPLLYLQTCEYVFRYHGSEIALSKRAAGARQAPDFALDTDVHLRTDWQSHNQRSHRPENENTRWKVWEDSTDSKRGKLKIKGSEMRIKGRKLLLCAVFVRWTSRSLGPRFEDEPQGFWVQIKGKERRGNECVYSACVCCLKIASESQFDTSLRLCFTWHLKQYWISWFGT